MLSIEFFVVDQLCFVVFNEKNNLECRFVSVEFGNFGKFDDIEINGFSDIIFY